MSPRTGRRRGGSSATSRRAVGENVVAFPEPARPRRRWARWAVAAFALVALVAGGLALYFSSVLAVDRIEVSGTRLVDRADVEERLRPLYGVPLPQIGRGRVNDLAGDLPGVESLDMIADPPTGLQVTVHEQEPVAARVADGAARVLMADGSVLTSVPERALTGERLVDVAPAVFRADEATRRTVAQVVAGLPEDLRQRLQEVSAAGPEAVSLRLSDGPRIAWGDAGEPRVKAAVVESLLGQDEETLASVDEIDVTVPDRPVTR